MGKKTILNCLFIRMSEIVSRKNLYFIFASNARMASASEENNVEEKNLVIDLKFLL
jgi:hypothetical protein